MIFVAALVVLALGWIGLFFGRLIQAAVSRNRESLADASAVQFTRDPTGLRNALVKIGALGAGSRFSDADAEEVAHMLFAPGIQRAFATHPPLEERIREIDPSFQPSEFDEVRRRMSEARTMDEEEHVARTTAGAARSGGLLQGAVVLAPAAVVGLVANPGTEHVLQAQAVLESLPTSFQRAARQPEQATALFLALGIDVVPDARERQLAFIHQQYGGEFHDSVTAMLGEVDRLTAVQRMPALLQVFAALSQLGRAERVELLKCLNGLLVRESRASVFAYALRKLAQVQLQDNLDPRQARGRLPQCPGCARRAAGLVLGARDAGERRRGGGARRLRGGRRAAAAGHSTADAAPAALAAEVRPGAHAPGPAAAGCERAARAGARHRNLARPAHDRVGVGAAARDLRVLCTVPCRRSTPARQTR